MTSYQNPKTTVQMASSDTDVNDKTRLLGNEVRRNSAGPGTYYKLPRLLNRNRAFGQSDGRFNVVRSVGAWRYLLYYKDWFHTLVDMPTWRVCIVVFFMYFICFSIWGVLYFLAPAYCEMPQLTYTRSWFFSVQTMMTIGYNVPDSGFHDCGYSLAAVSCQCVVGCILDALCVGIIFERVARGQKRAATLLFSQQAVIRVVRNQLYLMVRVGEARKHQLVEAHVRMYAVVKQGVNQEPLRYVYFHSHPMRLTYPDDSLGSSLLLAWPSVVIHRIDAWSPLCPPDLAKRGHPDPKGDGRRQQQQPKQRRDPSVGYLFPEELRKISDVESGEREVLGLPLADKPAVAAEMTNGADGSGANSNDVWPAVEAVKQWLRQSDVSVDLLVSSATSAFCLNSTCMHVMAFACWFVFASSQIEIVCLVEGQEPAGGSAVQSRHSYTRADIAWHRMFAPCVGLDIATAKYKVHFDLFHRTLACPENGANVYPIEQGHAEPVPEKEV